MARGLLHTSQLAMNRGLCSWGLCHRLSVPHFRQKEAVVDGQEHSYKRRTLRGSWGGVSVMLPDDAGTLDDIVADGLSNCTLGLVLTGGKRPVQCDSGGIYM